MKTLLLAVLLAVLCGCGSGGGPSSPTAASVAPPDSVVAVTVNQDKSQGGDFLQDVTFRTGDGREYRVECCDVPVHLGDTVKSMPYGVATTLLFLNRVQVATIVDEAAMEEHIRTFDPEKEKAGAYDIGMEEVRRFLLEGAEVEPS